MIFIFNMKSISYSLYVFENISYFDRFHTKEIMMKRFTITGKVEIKGLL